MTQQQINNQHTEIAVQKTFERHLQSRIRHIQINITPHRKYKNSLPLQKYKKQTYKKHSDRCTITKVIPVNETTDL